jgi:hypothetical protein
LEKSNDSSECLSAFRPHFNTVLYNTQVNVAGNHLSGLLLFKKIPDNSIRVVFSNELGVKFFDFEYKGSEFKVHYIMKKLNRKAVVGQLKKDIGFLLMHRINLPDAESFRSGDELFFGFDDKNEKTYYITDSTCHNLLRIENSSPRKTKIIVYLTPYRSGMADSVYINHQTFEFNISLKQIER